MLTWSVSGMAILLTGLFGAYSMFASSLWDDPMDPIAITTEAVAAKRWPVLRVLHEEGQGEWQFYDDAEPLQWLVAVLKQRLLVLDPSLESIKDLPVGWEAVRESPSAKWSRNNVAQ